MKQLSWILVAAALLVILAFLLPRSDYDAPGNGAARDEELSPGAVRAPDGTMFQEPPTGPPRVTEN